MYRYQLTVTDTRSPSSRAAKRRGDPLLSLSQTLWSGLLRQALRAFLAMTTILLLSSCSQLNNKDTLRMNLGTEPPTLDWNIAQDYSSFEIISNIMVGLTRFANDSNGEAISKPGCAKSWEISSDGLTYTFHLDPKAQWTDGKAVQAQDFIDSFTRLLDPATAAPYAELLSMIDLQQSSAIDEKTLRVKLKYPASYFIYLTSFGITYPIRLDLIERYANDWTEPKNLVTNGPFKLKEWQHEYKILLERNDDFFQDLAKIKYLKYFMVAEQASAFTLYQNNQFDWIDNRSIPVSEHRKLGSTVKRFLLLRNNFIGFNTQKKPFNDKRVRQAFSFAINRQALSQIRSKGDEANCTWIPPSLSRFLDYETLAQSFKNQFGEGFELNGYHPELARKLLANAGYPMGKNFPEIEILIPSREDIKLQAETLQAMWAKELNINVKINAMEWKVFLDTLKKSPPHLFRSSWGADYPDPDSFMQLFISTNAFNEGRFSNSEYDALINQAARTPDLATRRRLYTRAEQILSQEEAAIIPLYIDKQTILKKPWVKDLVFNPMDLVFLDRVSLNMLVYKDPL